MSRHWLFFLGGLVAAIAVPTLIRSSYHLDVLSTAAVLAMLALSVAVVFGQLGYPSFGHAAFLGLGAYSIGLWVAYTGVSYWAVVPLALIPGALLGLFVGLVSARLAGAYFAIATLVVSQLLSLVASSWEEFTRGPVGMMVSVRPAPWTGVFGWNAEQAYLAGLLVILAIVVLLLANLFRSPTSRAWVAIREAPDLAEAVGIASKRARVFNVTVSGALASLAGALFIPKVFVISPELFGIGYSATAILAVILGGKQGVVGALIGGFIFAVLPEAFRPLGDWNFGAFALIMLLSVLMLPGGLVSIPARVRGSRTSAAPLSRTGTEEVEPLTVRAAGAAGTPVLAVENVSKRFGGVNAVQDVTFDVRAGEIVGLIGPNGAGKTTLFHLLTGFHRPDAGRVTAFGESIIGKAPHAIARLGLVRTFQQTAVLGTSTVLDNVLTGAHLAERPSFFASLLQMPAYRRREARRRALALGCLDEVRLIARAEDQAGSLPYGEQKLLGVAIALASSPKVLLLDEPAAGLNAAEAKRLGAALVDLGAKGLTLVVVDHNLPLLMSIADRIVVLHHGEKIAEGTPAEIAANKDVVTAYLGGMVDSVMETAT